MLFLHFCHLLRPAEEFAGGAGPVPGSGRSGIAPCSPCWVGCGLRRSELAGLACDQIEQREGRWVIVDIEGREDWSDVDLILPVSHTGRTASVPPAMLIRTRKMYSQRLSCNTCAMWA